MVKGFDFKLNALVFLISLVILGFIYYFILPFFSGLSEDDFSKFSLEVLPGENTFFDNSSGYAFVHLKRGDDDVFLSGMKVVFFSGEDVAIFEVPEDYVLEPRQRKIYPIYFSDSGFETVDHLVVVPIFEISDRAVEGIISSRVPISFKSINLTEDEMKNIRNEADRYLLVA